MSNKQPEPRRIYESYAVRSRGSFSSRYGFFLLCKQLQHSAKHRCLSDIIRVAGVIEVLVWVPWAMRHPIRVSTCRENTKAARAWACSLVHESRQACDRAASNQRRA